MSANNDNFATNSEMTSFDYFQKRKVGKTYISKRLKNRKPNGSERDIRIITKVIDCEKGIKHEYMKLKKEIILRVTPARRQQIVAKIYEDTKGIFILSIQRYSVMGGIPCENYFSFVGYEIRILKDFIESIPLLELNTKDKSKVEDDEILKIKAKVLKNADLISEALKRNVTKTDIVSLGYRKNQLGAFHNLLTDSNFFLQKKKEHNKSKDEDLWQYFFESNPWIFGYGLNFSFNEPFSQIKLQQMIKGFDIKGRGKKVDALLKTKGVINSICLVEIKKSDTPLLKEVKEAYRPECWQLSNELNGGIAQIQKNSQKTVENIGTKLEIKSEDGSPTGDIVFSYLPKSYLIIGNLEQFKAQNGINEEKYSSFELYRKNIINPEIITFDELFERAKFIVETNERSAK